MGYQVSHYKNYHQETLCFWALWNAENSFRFFLLWKLINIIITTSYVSSSSAGASYPRRLCLACVIGSIEREEKKNRPGWPHAPMPLWQLIIPLFPILTWPTISVMYDHRRSGLSSDFFFLFPHYERIGDTSIKLEFIKEEEPNFYQIFGITFHFFSAFYYFRIFSRKSLPFDQPSFLRSHKQRWLSYSFQ